MKYLLSLFFALTMVSCATAAPPKPVQAAPPPVVTQPEEPPTLYLLVIFTYCGHLEYLMAEIQNPGESVSIYAGPLRIFAANPIYRAALGTVYANMATARLQKVKIDELLEHECVEA